MSVRQSPKFMQKQRVILTAAEQLFVQNGYGATTMDAVAQTAGVTKQTVYRYFVSKQKLLICLIEQHQQQSPAFSFSQQSIEDELYRYGLAFLEFHFTTARLNLFQLMFCESKTQPEVAAIFKSQAQPMWQHVLESFLQQCLKCEVKTDQYVAMFHALLLHQRVPVLMGLRAVPSNQEIKEWARESTDLFLHGINKRN